MPERFPVVVVGGGPVGLALVADLGWRGVRSALVERRDGSIYQPKMDMVGIRTMEFCRRWGIVDNVHKAGYNSDYVQDCAWVTDLNGLEFGREELPSPAAEVAPPESPSHRERCPQNFFDPVLRQFAESTGHVDFRYRTEMLFFEDKGDHVLIVLKSLLDDRVYEIEADYLVGADGGESQVRETLGIAMKGEGTLTYTTNAIFRCDGLESLHTTAPAYRYIFIGPTGTWATLVAINGRDEWRFSLIGDKTQRVASQQEMEDAIVRAVGRPFDFEILSILPWERRQLVAESYGYGRVFIAGDAAHLTSPTGGFGMNTGILDAVNLSWKLAARLEGWGGETLLQSYEIEQHPVAERNVGEATENLARMLSPRVANPDPAIFDETDLREEAVIARKEFGDAYSELMAREWYTIGIHLGYLYEGSPVVVAENSPEPELTVSTYTQTARPGSRAPHVWLDPEETVSILDHFGREFVLLRFQEEAGVEGFVAAANELGAPLKVRDIDSASAARLYEAPLVLVRPDGQVAWRGDDARKALEVLSQACGRSSARADDGGQPAH